MKRLVEISQIRLVCLDHNEPLQNCGNGQIFAPTYTTIEEASGADPEQDGWFYFDTSEFYCPKCMTAIENGVECPMNWTAQVR